jgi:hypothetical protein
MKGLVATIKLQILKRVKELIEDERHWCQGCIAMDERGVCGRHDQ